MEIDPQRYFFILGCQRSGTTLLRLILESHSEIFCYDEVTGYQALMTRDFSASYGSNRVGFKIPRWTEQLMQPQFSDKGQVEVTSNFYASHKLLFMLRDVRDTVTSMLKLGAGSGNWLTNHGQEILAAKMQQDAFRQQFASEIAILKTTKYRSVAIGALYWKYKTQAYFDYHQQAFPMLGIQYEYLVTSPDSCLRRVTDFLGLEWEDAVLNHDAFSHREVYPSGLTVGNTDPRRAIDTRSLNAWERTLQPEQQEIILAIAGDLNDRVHRLPSSQSGQTPC
ncbi:MAG: sulfotransferase [Anaerolineae bacterium]|nr:sulfotransferase [Anaerolineae bacterium]